MNKLPQVVLIGRMNVGKSTLFNRIAHKTAPLMLDYEGVTRDFLREDVIWNQVPFTLLDTGGISLKKLDDPILEQVRTQALNLTEHADVILFMIDGSVGLTSEELELAKRLHKTKRPVIVVVNKVDKKITQENIGECSRLGFEYIQAISAEHSTGVDELLDIIVTLIPHTTIETKEKERVCRVTLLGKPNIGKSSLMNILLKEERSIVTDVAGTTREAITEAIQFNSQTIELTDTAGVRRKKSVNEELEELMVKSSMQAVRTSDIVLLLVDAQEGRLTDQELKLAFYAWEEGKALILLINKEDLINDYAKEGWKYHLDEYKFFYHKLEMLKISCKNGKNIHKILPLIDKVWHRYMIEFSTDELTRLFKEGLMRRPLYKQEHQLKLRDAKQLKSGPPQISLHVNFSKFFGERELAYFDRVLRSAHELKSVPIKFIVQ